MTEPLRWVFGYGSLIWRPGFPFVRSEPALLSGAHRRLCIYSHRHRGTPERPGLVFGLVRGGSCRGMGVAGDARKDGVLRPLAAVAVLQMTKVLPAAADENVWAQRLIVALRIGS